MKLYVHKYPNLQAMAECREVPDDAPIPDAPLELMTVAELAAWKAESAQVQWLADFEAARLAAIAAADADAAADRNLVQTIITESQNMIDGVGTNTERQRRVELGLGRLLQYLVKRRKELF